MVDDTEEGVMIHVESNPEVVEETPEVVIDPLTGSEMVKVV